MDIAPSGLHRTLKLRPSALFIIYKQALRYLRVGLMLHLVFAAGFLIFTGFGKSALTVLEQERLFAFIGHGYFSIYGVVLMIFSQMDARSRFQNYKFAKDLFYRHGFKERIADLFVLSRCQRAAVMVAATDIGIEKKLKEYFHFKGYRWFHLIPDKVICRPQTLLTWIFWKKTLFVPYYRFRHFLW